MGMLFSMYSVVFSAVHISLPFMSQPRRKRVTLRDVAQIASVSEKTVSNVINNWPYISLETRERVKRAMVETGYRPSQVARSLVTGRTHSIGIVVPDISNPFFSTAFRGCEDKLNGHQYSVFLCNTDEDLEREKYYLESLVNRGVDGLILMGSRADEAMLHQYVGNDVPVISIDGSTQSGPLRFTAIEIDNAGGAERMVQHLIEHGNKKIAYLSGASHRLPARERFRGYRKALEAAGLVYDSTLVVEESPSIGGGYNAALTLLQHHQPDALFCYNDLMAIGAIAAAEELNLKVVDELAVVGFDDIAPAALITPMLSTVRIPQYELGQAAVEELMLRLEDQDLPSRVLSFPVELRIRNSCGTRRISSDERRIALRQLATSVSSGLPAEHYANGTNY